MLITIALETVIIQLFNTADMSIKIDLGYVLNLWSNLLAVNEMWPISKKT